MAAPPRQAAAYHLAAHYHGRRDLRTFRVHRMSGTTVTESRALEPLDKFDPVAHVRRLAGTEGDHAS